MCPLFSFITFLKFLSSGCGLQNHTLSCDFTKDQGIYNWLFNWPAYYHYMHYWTHWASNLSQDVFGSKQRRGKKLQKKHCTEHAFLGFTYWSMGKLYGEKLLLSKIYTAHTVHVHVSWFHVKRSTLPILVLLRNYTRQQTSHYGFRQKRHSKQSFINIYLQHLTISHLFKIRPSPQNQHSVHGTIMHNCIMEGEEVHIVKIPGVRSKFEHCVHRERGEERNTEQPQPTGFSSVI